MKKIVSAIAASGLLVTPVLAQGAETVRTASPVEDAEALEGTGGAALMLLLGAAVIAGLVLITDDEEDDLDSPVSP